MSVPAPTPVSKVPEYDYIICGGGTSGAAVAGRIAEDHNASVLLIEAGQHNDLLENTHFVGGWNMGFGTSANWNILTEPSDGIDNRRVAVSRGRHLGGCSGVDGSLIVRGVKKDYDDWGLKGWSGDEFWDDMTKAETFHPKDWLPYDPKNHGTSGPLHTSPMDPAPITNLILESMVDQGMPLIPDLFVSGEAAQGCGYSVRTVHEGIRVTSADFIKNAGQNLKVLTETAVGEVNLTLEGGEWRASGVTIVGKDGNLNFVKVRKEVVVSGGAYCSPAILLRSGIGAKAEVESFGIESKVDLPGVGKNLLDHLIVFIFYEISKSGITTDHLIYRENGFEDAYKQWKETKSGFLSNSPFGAFSFARLDKRLEDSPLWRDAPRKEGHDPIGLGLEQPNIEIFTTECYGGPAYNTDLPLNGESTFSMIPELFSPRSQGTVTLKSKHPLENPVVDHNYLSDPLDLLVLSEACRYANEIIMKGAGTRNIVKGAWPPASKHHMYTTRDDWVPFIKKHASTCYHAGGTCKMGTRDDPLAVLDERLRVRGVKGLRVADTSVMPTLNSGHTQMPAYGIGEKCADMIKEDSLIGEMKAVGISE